MLQLPLIVASLRFLLHALKQLLVPFQNFAAPQDATLAYSATFITTSLAQIPRRHGI